MARQGRIRIGTAGWSYSHWVGPYYPEGTRSRDFLAYYLRDFDTTELNNTFYNLPKPERFQEWRDAVPADFRFACKASRYITHMKKLKDPGESTKTFFQAVDHLGDRLGPILFQLPPNWRLNLGRLRDLLEVLPAEGYRYAFEFRDDSWFDDAVLDLLREHGAALVIYDLEGSVSPVQATADFVYLRLHGPGETAYTGSYDEAALQDWAERIDGWRREGRDVYCFFDNDEAGYAALNAKRLRQFLGA